MDKANRIKGLSLKARWEQDPRNCYETPIWLVERIHLLLGGIELDPCTNARNPCRATRFYTPADDGILQRWDASTIFVNPPYGKTIRHWVGKSLDAAHQGSKVLILVPSRTDAKWFQEAARGAVDILLIAGRLRFHSTEDDGEMDAPFPSVFMSYNCSLSSLSDLGTLVTTKAAGNGSLS